MRRLAALKLGERFAVANFSVAVFLVGVLVFLQAQTAKRAIRQRARVEAEVTLEQTAALCRSRLLEGRTDDLFGDLQPLAELERFASIDVLGPGGAPLVELTNPRRHRGLTQDAGKRREAEDVLQVSQDLVEGGRTLGRLEIGLWVRGIETDLRRIERQGLLAGGLICFGMALVSWLLGDGLSLRLRRLTGAILAQPSTQFARVAIGGTDEVGALARAFNDRQDLLRAEQERRLLAEAHRQDMVNMVVHDMKGPLTVYRSGIPFLRERAHEVGDERVEKMVEMFAEASLRLTRMTEAVLQMARLEDETLPLTKAPVDLAELVAHRAEAAKVPAQAKGVAIKTTAPGDVPPKVDADAEVLARVIDNLIFNAIEHAPKDGKIELRVKAEDGGVRVEVRDTGPGVAPEDRAKIFEKFRKGRALSQGVGLGLAFCEKAVERHGGTIGVEDAPGGGALFYFTLPG